MTTPDMPKPTIETRIERSSLGTTEARRMRARTPDSIAHAVVARARAYPSRFISRNSSRKVGG